MWVYQHMWEVSSEWRPKLPVKQKGAALLLLDLRAAIHTIDHGILLHALQHEVSITGEFLRWIECYLKDRSQAFRIILGKHSKDTPLKCGVPLDSVLGPFLFSVYTIPLTRILKTLHIQRIWGVWLISGSTNLPQGVTIGSSIPSFKTAKLGCDATISLNKHITRMLRAAYYHLRAIGRIRRYLDGQSSKQLGHALVISRLDINNSFLYGTARYSIIQL